MAKRAFKAFIEITNVCNLNCSFCHGTARAHRFMSEEEFALAAGGVQGFADYLYFHLMGEPLLHPNIGRFFEIAGELGFRVILTTNGTLLKRRERELLSAPSLHKVSISLHAYEANEMGISLESYLSECFDFCKRAAKQGIIVVMRLWNIGGEEEKNKEILCAMHRAFPEEWRELYSGYKLADKVFLEWGERFDWPDADREEMGSDHTCYGLRDQIGVLSDGTVVPCCLDADGAIPLGNIFEEKLENILASERAVKLKNSLEQRSVSEHLCRRCGYARQKKY
ncbi:MAG: radical SAM protein [Clostridia bacterium]|nr:radical SAM protein [Clostridia bacterium]